jgi:protease I
MKTKLLLLCALALCVIALGACTTPPPTATPVPPPDPAAVIKSLAAALNAGNVDSVMTFYADDATITQQPAPAGQSGILSGKEQIRGFVQGLVAGHFSGELSNLRVTGDQVTYTGSLSTDTYRKMGVAPLVVTEETMIVGGKIKSQTITVTPESLAKIQAAMAAQAKAATQKKVLLILSTEKSQDWPVVLTKEVGVMVSLLEKAGYKAVVASVSGQTVGFGDTTLKPDLKLADVKIEDYAGLILPCLASPEAGFKVPPDAAEIVKKAVALGKPVAAQNVGVFTLAKAGVLKGKQFALLSGYQSYVPEGIYKGEGVVQDGNIVTSGTCPYTAMPGKPDGTPELTQKFITLLASAR